MMIYEIVEKSSLAFTKKVPDCEYPKKLLESINADKGSCSNQK